MTQKEKDQILGETVRKLRETKQERSCWEVRASKAAESLDAIRQVLLHDIPVDQKTISHFPSIEAIEEIISGLSRTKDLIYALQERLEELQ